MDRAKSSRRVQVLNSASVQLHWYLFDSINHNLRYHGEWCFGKMDGLGTLTTTNGNQYVGEFSKGAGAS